MEKPYSLSRQVLPSRLRPLWFKAGVLVAMSPLFYVAVMVGAYLLPEKAAPTALRSGYHGYTGGTTQFRNITISDGKAPIAQFKGDGNMIVRGTTLCR